MSFRNRLTLFFIVIVILPMLAVGAVLFYLVANSERGKDDAQLGQGQRAAAGLYREFLTEATEAGAAIGSDRELARRLRLRDDEGAERRLAELAADTRSVRVRIDFNGRRVSFGSGDVVAPQRRRLVDRGGAEVGLITVSTVSTQSYVNLLTRVTQLDVAVGARRGRPVTTQPGIDPAALKRRGTTGATGERYRYATFRATGFEGEDVTVALLSREEDTLSPVSGTRRFVGFVLVAFLGIAFGFALLISRSLQGQIQRLLEAAKRIGGGDFAIEVPTEGHDEFAALASEFNAMAGQLEVKVEELETERVRLQTAIRRIGESFASNLDRTGLLDIVVHTAVDGVAADCGRATVREEEGEPLRQFAANGDIAARGDAVREVETAVLASGEKCEVTVGEVSALAHPLRTSDEKQRLLGIISVARAGRPFSLAEQELFTYLANQAAVSIENVDLHETVQRQAVTDELTRLANKRRFLQKLDNEIGRTRRGGQDVGLILLDIDNFKRINDTYGHPQGDLVLKEIARVMREVSREIDEPARYGGEEMAVVLPQTDMAGAVRAAERMRERIEELAIPLLDDDDATMHVTASFGAATLLECDAADRDALIAAADVALYEAKRAGKNRTVQARAVQPRST